MSGQGANMDRHVKAPFAATPQKGGRAVGILQGTSPEVLREIGARGVGAAIWQRALPEGFAEEIAALPAARLPELRETLSVAGIGACLRDACAASRLPAGPLRDHLIGDVTAQAQLFAEISGARRLHLRLQPITTNACSRFHIDNLRLRMLCTYCGAGTEFALGAPGSAPEAPIADAPTGAVVLMRGTLWPGAEAPGVLHRSPPIAGSGQTRLLLVIDPGDEPEPHWH